jgi:probable rRNA maturation factor
MIAVRVGDKAWTRALPDAAAIAKAAAHATLKDARIRAGLAVLLADNASLSSLNGRFRGKDGPTNVLAFPPPAGERENLRDIALAFGVCAREAGEQDKPLADHLSHLVVHGVLHLIGYDHRDPGEAESMEAKERELLARMGIADPYAVR